MQQASHSDIAEVCDSKIPQRVGALPVTVIVAARNEARNLPRCLQSVSDFSEVYVVDSHSTDATPRIAREYGAKLIDFYYQGGWPKKRQWALDTLPFVNHWILLLDADESVPADLRKEIHRAIQDQEISGYYISLRVRFLGRVLRHSGASFQKLCLFRSGKGHFECRLERQDASMCDMEVHEHVVVDGPTGNLLCHLEHNNIESLARYIEKHNEYSNWEARVLTEPVRNEGELKPALFGSQAQRRRWLKANLFRLPGSPLALFLYRYLFRLGFMDGIPGLIYCSFQAVQMFHTKAKIYELNCGLRANRVTDISRQNQS